MKYVSLVIMSLFLTSCATRKEEAKIEQKVTAETEVTDGQSLSKELSDTVINSKTLTDLQKQELKKIMVETRARSISLTQDSFKLRSVLIKELLSDKVNFREVSLIKKDIKKNEAERLKTTFSAIDRITKIVAKDVDKAIYVNHMLDMNHY